MPFPAASLYPSANTYPGFPDVAQGPGPGEPGYRPQRIRDWTPHPTPMLRGRRKR